MLTNKIKNLENLKQPTKFSQNVKDKRTLTTNLVKKPLTKSKIILNFSTCDHK